MNYNVGNAASRTPDHFLCVRMRYGCTESFGILKSSGGVEVFQGHREHLANLDRFVRCYVVRGDHNTKLKTEYSAHSPSDHQRLESTVLLPVITGSQSKGNTMPSKFQIKKAKNGKHFFNLLASNGEVILTSQMYASKATAKKGIASVQSPLASKPERQQAIKNAISFFAASTSTVSLSKCSR